MRKIKNLFSLKVPEELADVILKQRIAAGLCAVASIAVTLAFRELSYLTGIAVSVLIILNSLKVKLNYENGIIISESMVCVAIQIPRQLKVKPSRFRVIFMNKEEELHEFFWNGTEDKIPFVEGISYLMYYNVNNPSAIISYKLG